MSFPRFHKFSTHYIVEKVIPKEIKCGKVDNSMWKTLVSVENL